MRSSVQNAGLLWNENNVLMKKRDNIFGDRIRIGSGWVLLILAIIIASSFSVAAEPASNGSHDAKGGYITDIEFSAISMNTDKWQGYYGQIIAQSSSIYPNPISPIRQGIGTIYKLELGANINEGDLILITNSSTVPALSELKAGNISTIDNITGIDWDSGTNTFTNTSTFHLPTIGINITNVPTIYTFADSNPQYNYFREGLLEDASGNIIFIVPLNSSLNYGFDNYTYFFQFMVPNNRTNPLVYSLYYVPSVQSVGDGNNSGHSHKTTPTPKPTPTPTHTPTHTPTPTPVSTATFSRLLLTSDNDSSDIDLTSVDEGCDCGFMGLNYGSWILCWQWWVLIFSMLYGIILYIINIQFVSHIVIAGVGQTSLLKGIKQLPADKVINVTGKGILNKSVDSGTINAEDVLGDYAKVTSEDVDMDDTFKSVRDLISLIRDEKVKSHKVFLNLTGATRDITIVGYVASLISNTRAYSTHSIDGGDNLTNIEHKISRPFYPISKPLRDQFKLMYELGTGEAGSLDELMQRIHPDLKKGSKEYIENKEKMNEYVEILGNNGFIEIVKTGETKVIKLSKEGLKMWGDDEYE